MYYICGKISKFMKNIDTHAAALMQEIIRNLRIDLTRRGALDKLQQQMETILDDKGNRNCGGFSVSTLKRLLGKVSSSGRFDLNTLDKLALIAGYADYATYLDRQNRTVLLSGTRETLDFSGCVPDSVITIREGANSLRLQNLGDGTLLVIESHGSPLTAGTRLPASLLERHTAIRLNGKSLWNTPAPQRHPMPLRRKPLIPDRPIPSPGKSLLTS